MIINKVYKFYIYPNKDRQIIFAKVISEVSWVQLRTMFEYIQSQMVWKGNHSRCKKDFLLANRPGLYVAVDHG